MKTGVLSWKPPVLRSSGSSKHCSFLASYRARATTDSAHVVKYGQNDIVPVKAKLRFSAGAFSTAAVKSRDPGPPHNHASLGSRE